jgi:hypothetical protein
MHGLATFPPGPRPAGVIAARSLLCVVPSRYGVFSAQRTCPDGVSASRTAVTGGRLAAEFHY